jgi:hypothetical protein
MMPGTLVIFIALLAWALPIAILVWFVLTVREIRDRLRSIDRRLVELDPTSR